MKKSLLGKLIVLIGIVSIWTVLVGVPNVTQAEGESVETLAVDPEYNMVDIFPDEEFRNLIVNILQSFSIPVVADGTVRQSQLNVITKVSQPNFNRKTIYTIDGAEYLINLENITLQIGKVHSIKPLENLKKIRYISIGFNEISDLSPLLTIAGNESSSLSVDLYKNRISDFTIIPKIERNKKNKAYFSMDLESQRNIYDIPEKITNIPIEVDISNIILHDGSLLDYETAENGYFSKGKYTIDKLHSLQREVYESVEKRYNDKINYGVSIYVDVDNNYLLPDGLQQNFTLNVNETFDFNRPFENYIPYQGEKFYYDYSYVVENKEILDMRIPGTYELKYKLKKFNRSSNPIENIPLTVTVNVLPVKYSIDFNLEHYPSVFKTVSTNNDMTVTPPSEIPKKDGYIFKGWSYGFTEDSFVDFSQPITGNSIFYAKWEKDKPQGNYIPDGRYVTVVKKGSEILNDFDGGVRNNTDSLYQKTFLAKGRYEHRNGKTYYSIFDGKGKWQGYVDSEATKVSNSKQGVFFNENRYVTVIKKGYGTWTNFNWKSRLSSQKVLNKTYQVKGRYEHVNGSTYYSLYDSKGKWQGYISAAATKKANGKQGAYLPFSKYVKVNKKGYHTYQNFSWKKKYSSNRLLNERFEVRGKYNHINGTSYYSLYNINGLWQGYISEKAVK